MNQWNERFSQDRYVYGTEPNEFLAGIQNKLKLPGDKVLAIAEGEGRNAAFLAEQGLIVTAWDYAESGLIKTDKLAKTKGVSVNTKLIDLKDVDWKQENWDEIVCIFGHFPKKLRTKTLQGVKEAVKPGGYFITEVYSHYQLPYKSGGPKDLGMLYRPEEFLDTFSDWHIIHFFIGEVVRHEGEFHNGLSHVIQFAGLKPL